MPVSKTKIKSPVATLNGNPSYDPDFEVPCTAAWEFITPDLARQYLAAGNLANRDVRHPPVARLRGVIDRHEWMYDSTDAIGLTEEEAVVNGQHRLTTIAEGDQGVWCLVTRGVRPEVVRVIDQGVPRSLSQTLGIIGGYAEPGTTATAVKWLYRMTKGLEKQVPGALQPTVPQGLELLSDHPHLVDSLESAAAVRSYVSVLSKGVLTAYHYTFASVDPDQADEFFDKLATGVHVGQNEPVYALRERFIADLSPKISQDKHLKEYEAAHFLVLAWEATRAGEAMLPKALKFIRSGTHATTVASVTGLEWLTPHEDEEEEAAS